MTLMRSVWISHQILVLDIINDNHHMYHFSLIIIVTKIPKMMTRMTMIVIYTQLHLRVVKTCKRLSRWKKRKRTSTRFFKAIY